MRAITADGVTKPLSSYSQAIAAGGLLFLSGHGPLDAEARVVGDTIEEQTRATLSNLAKLIEAAGASLKDVMKVTVHLASIADCQRFNAVYEQYFVDSPFPARTCVAVGELWSGLLVEIDGVAQLPPTPES